MLKINQVSQAFKDNVVLDNVTFTAEKGEIIGLVAPNGTGKTTLLNIIMNFLKPDKGSVSIKGEIDYSSKKKEIKMHQHISFLPELEHLYGELSGLEHLNFYARMWKGNIKDVPDIVKSLRMDNYVKNRVQTYSLGMRQRLCFSMLLAADTEVMLMDEVMNGLDPDNVNLLTSMLIELKKKGKTILIASHLLDNLDLYADRVLFLKDGDIVLEKKEQVDNPRDELFIKVHLTSDQYKEIKQNFSFPEGTRYIADKLLCVPLVDLSEDEVGMWTTSFVKNGHYNVTIGEIGTSEWYDEFYNKKEQTQEIETKTS